MTAYLHPGVYIEEIPSGARPIEAVGTSTAVFLGSTARGPIGEPRRITQWEEYERRYAGGQTPMDLAVRAFFLNGGSTTYIVRLADGADKASATHDQLTIDAIDEGTWGNELSVDLAIANGEGTVTVKLGEAVVERFVGPVALDDPGYLGHRVADESQFVRLVGAPSAVNNLVLIGGTHGNQPTEANYTKAFAKLAKIREISIVCLPDQTWAGDSKAIIELAISHAESTMNRVVLIDPPQKLELIEPTEVTDMNLPTSTYAVLYYPWVFAANPAYDAELNPGATRTLPVSPSAFAAGMYGRIDGRRGVWKAPAGVETGLLGVARLEFAVEDGEQDVLNPLGVNCLRSLPGYGHVIWGARTLATKAKPEWRYVPVRRTAIMIEESIHSSIQWAVFEPNDEPLWSSLRVNIGSFMDGLFRSGAFQGRTSNEAYFVRCGLGDTMTQGDIDRGQVIVVVGFAPLKPAEFVIVRIQQKVAQQ